MALDMNKYKISAQANRKLPIIFMINEKMLWSEKWDGGMFKSVISNIMRNLSHRNIDAIMSLVSFGEEVHLWSGFKEFEKYKDSEWPKPVTKGKSVFNIGCMLVKDMLEDIDTTPDGNYDPVVILISSYEVSPGYAENLEELKKDGRFNKIQRIGVADLSYDGSSSYFSNHYTGDKKREVNTRAPKILKEFAGDKIALYISDIKHDSWCTTSNWAPTEYKDEDTWFCPILSMINLRYTDENGHSHSKRVCEDENSGHTGVWSTFGKIFPLGF